MKNMLLQVEIKLIQITKSKINLSDLKQLNNINNKNKINNNNNVHPTRLSAFSSLSHKSSQKILFSNNNNNNNSTFRELQQNQIILTSPFTLPFIPPKEQQYLKLEQFIQSAQVFINKDILNNNIFKQLEDNKNINYDKLIKLIYQVEHDQKIIDIINGKMIKQEINDNNVNNKNINVNAISNVKPQIIPMKNTNKSPNKSPSKQNNKRPPQNSKSPKKGPSPSNKKVEKQKQKQTEIKQNPKDNKPNTNINQPMTNNPNKNTNTNQQQQLTLIRHQLLFIKQLLLPQISQSLIYKLFQPYISTQLFYKLSQILINYKQKISFQQERSQQLCMSKILIIRLKLVNTITKNMTQLIKLSQFFCKFAQNKQIMLQSCEQNTYEVVLNMLLAYKQISALKQENQDLLVMKSNKYSQDGLILLQKHIYQPFIKVFSHLLLINNDIQSQFIKKQIQNILNNVSQCSQLEKEIKKYVKQMKQMKQPSNINSIKIEIIVQNLQKFISKYNSFKKYPILNYKKLQKLIRSLKNSINLKNTKNSKEIINYLNKQII